MAKNLLTRIRILYINIFLILVVSIIPILTPLYYHDPMKPGQHGQSEARRQRVDHSSKNPPQVSTTTTNTSSVHQHVIFYNVYIPSDLSGTGNALNIVQEQIAQVATTVLHKTPVYFTVIGNYRALRENDIRSICTAHSAKLDCTLHKTAASGDEVLTLEQLKDYCDSSVTDNSKVTYLHNKGSFHVNEYNAQWRRALTAAAISPDCVSPPTHCNVCGLQFYTQFTSFIPGNMWSADCIYVQKLLPLSEYKLQKSNVVQNILVQKFRNQLHTSLFPNKFCRTERMDFYGIDRFSSEHWIASHPDVVPCDMDPNGSLDDIFTGKTSLDMLRWSLAPRHPGFVIANDPEVQTAVHQTNHLRLQEYFLLPGQLVKWFHLYGTAPPSQSWAWTWFPDGAVWKRAVQLHGDKAIEAVTNSLAFQDDGHHVKSAFSNRFTPIFPIRDNTDEIKEIDVDDEQQPTVIFYHISMPAFEEVVMEPKAKAVIEKQMNIINESYLVQASNRPVKLYYTLAVYSNAGAMNFVQTQCAKFNNIECIHIGTVERDFAGDTLQHLYQFCGAHPSSQVIHINNISIMRLPEPSRESVLFFSTRAVTSQPCQNLNATECDTCGLSFYSLWTFFYPGNIFAANCNYINKLLPPDTFEKKLNAFLGIVLLERLRGRFVTQLFPDDTPHFGMDDQSIEHWLGSHPSLRACQVCGAENRRGIFDWFSEDRANYQFSTIVPAISFPVAPFDLTMASYRASIQEEKNRIREYSYLAGNLMKWFYLYDTAPPDSSWIWTAFPDGEEWKNSYLKYGTDVVNQMTTKFMPVREF